MMMYKGLIQKFVARIGIEPTTFRCVPTDALPTELPDTFYFNMKTSEFELIK